jgi:hypothetical protein
MPTRHLTVLLVFAGMAVALGGIRLSHVVQGGEGLIDRAAVALASLVFGSVGLVFISRREVPLGGMIRGPVALGLGALTLLIWWGVAAVIVARMIAGS